MSSINASRNYLHDVSNALIASGYTSLDKQAKALGPQSQHGLDYRKQNNCAHSGKSDTPASVRTVIQQYIAERLKDQFVN